MSTETAFRRLHHASSPLLLPNVWDYAGAAALAEQGFPAVGTTSLGVAAACGKPDAAGAIRGETLALARSVSRLPCLLTVDIEGGFGGGPKEVAELAAELAAMGVAGINLEDGRSDGSLAPPEYQCELIAAIKARTPLLFVNARTDTYWSAQDHPSRMEETLRRAQAYVVAGADGVFVPGLSRAADIAEVARSVTAPLNVLLQSGGLGLAELGDLGVARVSTGSLLYRAALHAAVTTAVAARDGGRAPEGLPSYADVERLLPS
ncbi:MAG: hypothetical protein JWN52_4407 [Actinomycetia bacterium]|nr:hypothetical protein [Actinomycetes bacterium]